MKRIEQLYKQLTNFLNLRAEDRQDVVSWYDELNPTSIIDEAEQLNIKQSVKKRVLDSIKKDSFYRKTRRLYRWSAAAAVFFICGSTLIYFISKDDFATQEQLASVTSAKERAIIILEDGTKIYLEDLKTNQTVVVGQTRITKNDNGDVSYRIIDASNEKIQMNCLYVPKASTYQLTLEDGTRVILNSDSKLTYPSSFGNEDRIVKLEGEGYFEVTKTTNKSKFIVEANNQKIEVLGTKFNVKSYQNEGRDLTTLVEGSVRINALKNSIVLIPNEQAISIDNTLEKRKIDVNGVLSWTKGQFCFDGTNTKEVLEDIGRWYDIDINYTRSANEEQYIGKIPRNLSLDKLIELLNYAELKTQSTIGNNKRVKLTIT